MQVGIRDLRNNISRWIERASRGQEIIVTDRGRAVARITSVDRHSRLEDLIAAGVVQRARAPRTRAARRRRVRAKGGVSDLVARQRR